jgi:polar amino acid transport system permease protein
LLVTLMRHFERRMSHGIIAHSSRQITQKAA